MMMKKAPLGSGKRFAALEEKVEKNYEKKGMSPAKAAKVGAATAAAIGFKKYGKEKMAKMAAKGRTKK
jgi:hypothetical protein